MGDSGESLSQGIVDLVAGLVDRNLSSEAGLIVHVDPVRAEQESAQK